MGYRPEINVASGKLLEKLGLTFEKMIQLPEDGKDMCKLFIPKHSETIE